MPSRYSSTLKPVGSFSWPAAGRGTTAGIFFAEGVAKGSGSLTPFCAAMTPAKVPVKIAHDNTMSERIAPYHTLRFARALRSTADDPLSPAHTLSRNVTLRSNARRPDEKSIWNICADRATFVRPAKRSRNPVRFRSRIPQTSPGREFRRSPRRGREFQGSRLRVHALQQRDRAGVRRCGGAVVRVRSQG